MHSVVQRRTVIQQSLTVPRFLHVDNFAVVYFTLNSKVTKNLFSGKVLFLRFFYKPKFISQIICCQMFAMHNK